MVVVGDDPLPFATKDEWTITQDDLRHAVINIDRVVMAVKLKGRMRNALQRARTSLSRGNTPIDTSMKTDGLAHPKPPVLGASTGIQRNQAAEGTEDELLTGAPFFGSASESDSSSAEQDEEGAQTVDDAGLGLSASRKHTFSSTDSTPAEPSVLDSTGNAALLELEAEDALNGVDDSSAGRDLVLSVMLQQLIDPEAVTWIKTRAANLRIREVDERREDLNLMDLVKSVYVLPMFRVFSAVSASWDYLCLIRLPA